MPSLIMDDDDGVIAMLRESVAGFAEGRPGPQTTRAVRRASSDMDVAQWQEMAAAGWIGLLLPEELGGPGLGIRHQAVISEGLGRALLPSPLVAASVLPSALLRVAPASAERDRLASALVSGEAIIVAAISDQPGKGRLSARLDKGGLVLDGRLEFVEAAHAATDFIVLAVIDGKDALVSVPATSAGLQRIDRQGVEGSLISTLVFSGCRVGEDKMVDADLSAGNLGDAIDLGRVALAAELSGIAAQAFDMASSYTQQRVQFGKPIASFQVIQHRLVDLWMEAEMACNAVVNAVERLEENDHHAAHLAVLAAKARASDAAFLIGRRAIHLYGAMGFTDECDIGLYLKRAINLGGMLGQADSLRRQFVIEERAA